MHKKCEFRCQFVTRGLITLQRQPASLSLRKHRCRSHLFAETMRKLGKGVLTHYVRQAGPKIQTCRHISHTGAECWRRARGEREQVKCSIIASQTQNSQCESIRRVCIHLGRLKHVHNKSRLVILLMSTYQELRRCEWVLRLANTIKT